MASLSYTKTAVTCVPIVLAKNPNVSDTALSGVIEANIVNFQGSISVATKTHQFATGAKKARVIYVSPYGNIQDFLVTLKRFAVGVQFDNLTNNGAHITEYVLGMLTEGSKEYTEAQKETEQAFQQKRRFVIAIGNDCSDLGISLDQSQSACIIL